MSDIASGVGNLVTSIVEIIKGIITTIFHVFEGAFNAVLGVFKGMFNVTEGILGFIIGNFFLLGTLAAVYFGYILYQQRQGRNPAPLSAAATKKTR
ncbi:hypothetical protein LTR84_012361 [Exophiala bonariae]|uniref:Uncharacterized protein n=1 Tax=Exophiala bonariae TaxID=1690606 RepID=A0AAV9NG04_9EURO|nr:hypothetical protein LTR84_012361 [Exophiala bonariae]